MEVNINYINKMAMVPCLQAIIGGIIAQIVLQNVLVILFNFQIFHPLQSLADIFRIIFSFYWLYLMPVIGALLLYGVILHRNCSMTKIYYPSRFKWLMGCGLRKLTFCGAHVVVAFFVAFACIRLMRIDYKYIYIERYNRSCVNDRFLFLMGAGIAAGVHYFAKNFGCGETKVDFVLVPQCKLVAARNHILKMAQRVLCAPLIPLLAYVLTYWLFGNAFGRYLSALMLADNNDDLDSLFNIVTDFRLLVYAWLMWSEIWAVFYLLQSAYNTYMNEPNNFLIERNSMAAEVTIVDALGLTDKPIIQHWAALQLHNIGSKASRNQRMQIFELSVPGNHPYNWNQLADQCLQIINIFTEDLSESVKTIANMKTATHYQNLIPSFADSAERSLIRQYNEAFHIRRMATEPFSVLQTTNPSKISQNLQQNPQNQLLAIDKHFKNLKQSLEYYLRSVPCIFYVFGEQDGAKTAFLLQNDSQKIIWIAQGLASICVVSLSEDRYGVVQLRLPEIIKTLLRLKLELDKLISINLNGKKFDQSLNALRNAIKRNLHQIGNVFGNYFRDIISDAEDLNHLQSFINHRDMH